MRRKGLRIHGGGHQRSRGRVPDSRASEVKATMTLVGGVYRERCRPPYNSDETGGSGGRAAAGIADLGIATTLHTPVDSQAEGLLASLAQTFQFDTATTNVSATRQFHYDHALSSLSSATHRSPRDGSHCRRN